MSQISYFFINLPNFQTIYFLQFLPFVLVSLPRRILKKWFLDKSRFKISVVPEVTPKSYHSIYQKTYIYSYLNSFLALKRMYVWPQWKSYPLAYKPLKKSHSNIWFMSIRPPISGNWLRMGSITFCLDFAVLKNYFYWQPLKHNLKGNRNYLRGFISMKKKRIGVPFLVILLFIIDPLSFKGFLPSVSQQLN